MYKKINRVYVILTGLVVIIICSYIKSRPVVSKEPFNNSSDETACTYLATKGIIRSCTLNYATLNKPKEDVDFNYDTLAEGSTIYIPNSVMSKFIKYVKKIPHRFILVSGDGDETVFKDIFDSHEYFIDFIEQDKIIHWFSQNCTVKHPKISQIPIGLDYHTLSTNIETDGHHWGKKGTPVEQEKILNDIKGTALPFYDRKIQGYSNFQLNIIGTFAHERRLAVKEIPKDAVFYEPNKIPRIEVWNKQVQYAFVVSPPGNGLDCHRTWEALCLGCIPIVKTSELDPLFDDLPVLIVSSWSDITLATLESVIEKFRNRTFKYEKLTLSYWMDKIHSVKNSL